MTFVQKLAQLIDNKIVNKTTLAEKLDVTRQTLDTWLNKPGKGPKEAEVAALSKKIDNELSKLGDAPKKEPTGISPEKMFDAFRKSLDSIVSTNEELVRDKRILQEQNKELVAVLTQYVRQHLNASAKGA